MHQVIKTFLLVAGENFVEVGTTTFDSVAYQTAVDQWTLANSPEIIAEVASAGSNDIFTANMRQTALTNSYEALGVPVGSLVIGQRFLSAIGYFEYLSVGNTMEMKLSVMTDEHTLISDFDIPFSPGGAFNSDPNVFTVNKLSSDDFRLEVQVKSVFGAGGASTDNDVRLYACAIQIYYTDERGRQFFQSL